MTKYFNSSAYTAHKIGLDLFCRVLEKSHIGAKSDFEIWGFKGFFSLDPKKGPKEGL